MKTRKTILVAEDNKLIRNSLIDFLMNEGFGVIAAKNGAAAFMLTLEFMPDLIFSDIHMPVMNGMELLEKLKTDPCTSFIPLIFLTADVDFRELKTGIPKGAAGCILKPFTFSEILRAISIHLPDNGS
ncbi:MAG: response regulator [Bacteroidota bacterium]|jgi:CheY-like chemotaxis protein|nr:response regulator [Ignavibacteria bacterium]MCU7499405.1 response regulator [Ignavibacteria bacterium]MCU7511569.1 response regulator [Ignavibacteria bacterium]MCU7521074.1 response regulator [Ignavibacteria bacterium]MCU7524305.1 response regulator [Ignavibacteria bacterium]